MSAQPKSFCPQLEQLETRLVPASLFQVQTDFSRFISDLSPALSTAAQAGRDLVGGIVYHNQAEYSRGLAEWNAALGTVEGDYQRLQNDLSALQNIQAGVSSLASIPRMRADVGNMFVGSVVALEGQLTGNNAVKQNGMNIVTSAADDFIAAAFANSSQASQPQGLDGYGYDPNASKD